MGLVEFRIQDGHTIQSPGENYIHFISNGREYSIWMKDFEKPSKYSYEYDDGAIKGFLKHDGDFLEFNGPIQISNLHVLLSMTKHGLKNSWANDPNSAVLVRIDLDHEVDNIAVDKFKIRVNQNGPLVVTKLSLEEKNIGCFVNLIIKTDINGLSHWLD